MTQPFKFWAALALLILTAITAYSQTTTLTGAIQFSTDANGTAYGGLLWNTLGGDTYYNLWLAQNPDATLPINGPADNQAGIAIPLEVGHTYKFYIFGQPGPGIVTGFNGLNLFFDNNSAPGISASGGTNQRSSTADSKSTLTLQGTPVTGAGKTFYSASGAIVVLDAYHWNAPATPPGDVCQAFSFTPASGNLADYSGAVTLKVFPSAALTTNLPSASPGTRITLNGSGFAPMETVNIFIRALRLAPIATAMTDANGAFAITDREPAAPYGPEGIFALGQTSGKLGAVSLNVTPGLVISPHSVAPGGSAQAGGVGFGAGETVNVYLANPRQLLGSTSANAVGSFLGSSGLSITIPSNAPPGDNAVLGIGQSTGAIAIGMVKVE